ncbi:glycine zipper domain-containing protein [Fundidesulfovibrio soli]|uniref:glycine zipper domain-containing protein n=1 Tax=Fundidesulfovibrio soli TaxID=2922716 RepID=UPI0030149EDC
MSLKWSGMKSSCPTRNNKDPAMRRISLFVLIATSLCFAACTNMSRTEQGAMSGAAIGAGAGLGISAITGGSLGTGALVGGALGGVAGGLYGNQQEQQRYRSY